MAGPSKSVDDLVESRPDTDWSSLGLGRPSTRGRDGEGERKKEKVRVGRVPVLTSSKRTTLL